MRDLVELVGLIDKTKLKGSGILQAIIEPGSKMEQLYTAIADRQVQTDDDAAAMFSSKDQNGTSLTSVKSKLKERLLDSFFCCISRKPTFPAGRRHFMNVIKSGRQ